MLTDINPTFPIMQIHNKSENQYKVIQYSVFDDNIKRITERKNPLTDFADKQKTKESLILKQGIFHDRLGRISDFFDDAFDDTSKALLDD